MHVDFFENQNYKRRSFMWETKDFQELYLKMLNVWQLMSLPFSGQHCNFKKLEKLLWFGIYKVVSGLKSHS